MKKAQLRNIIKEVISEHQSNHVPPNTIPSTITPLAPSSDGSHHFYQYKANICPAKYAMFHTNLPISDIGNLTWINQQYATTGVLTPLPMVGNPNAIGGISQFFHCFQVAPSSESWWPYPSLGGFAELPQIQGLYSNIEQGVADGWLMIGSITSVCNVECNSLAVNYNNDPTLAVDREPDLRICDEPLGGCPVGPGGVAQIWQGAPVCKCFSPSVLPGSNPTLDLDLTIDTPLSEDPCDSWIDPGFQGSTCCGWCNSLGWPALAPTNVACGGTGTGGDPQGSNNWFCGCCNKKRLQKLANIN
mgnify:CR=1 FL=1